MRFSYLRSRDDNRTFPSIPRTKYTPGNRGEDEVLVVEELDDSDMQTLFSLDVRPYFAVEDVSPTFEQDARLHT